MGSNEALGLPPDVEPIDVDAEQTQTAAGKPAEVADHKAKGESSNLVKRKRVSKHDVVLWGNLTNAIQAFASVVVESNNNEVAPGLYYAVMSFSALFKQRGTNLCPEPPNNEQGIWAHYCLDE